VNFLLHHHLARAELASDLAAAGAMLPDLWRLADRRVRPAPREIAAQLAAASSDADERAVLVGVEHHREADRWFHATETFVGGERLVVERLREAAEPGDKLGRFAHVLWELCLDGALVRRLGLDTVLASLRTALDAACGPAAQAAASAHHFDRVRREPAARAAFEARLTAIRAELARGPWIASYASGRGLVACLRGIRARVGCPALARATEQRTEAALDAIASEADAALDRVLARCG
jgi:hypothetical protein